MHDKGVWIIIVCMKDRNFYTNANRRAWNEAAKVHQKHRGNSLVQDFSTPGHTILDETLIATLTKIGLAEKSIAHLCCNNGIELLSALNLGAKAGTGFDISDEAIGEAQSLADVSGLPGEFIRTDIYEIDDRFSEKFDMVWFTIGGLCWLPDLPGAFEIAARLLKPNGHLVIYDLHPFTMMFAVLGEPDYKNPRRIEYSYFATTPYSDKTGIYYICHTEYESPVKYDFPHKLSDIFSDTIHAGFEIVAFDEYTHDISNLFGNLEKDKLAPLCYLLHGRKK